MSKIIIKNQLPESITVSYDAIDGNRVKQSIGARKEKTSIKELKANSSVAISSSNNSKNIHYENGNRVLMVQQAGTLNDFGLFWQ